MSGANLDNRRGQIEEIQQSHNDAQFTIPSSTSPPPSPHSHAANLQAVIADPNPAARVLIERARQNQQAYQQHQQPQTVQVPSRRDVHQTRESLKNSTVSSTFSPYGNADRSSMESSSSSQPYGYSHRSNASHSSSQHQAYHGPPDYTNEVNNMMKQVMYQYVVPFLLFVGATALVFFGWKLLSSLFSGSTVSPASVGSFFPQQQLGQVMTAAVSSK